MKLGQGLATFPKLIPADCYRILTTLQFEAPPLHFSLLREQFVRELGAEPEELFAEFEHEAFAAASLGQVHRARLKTGERVAVKSQYPGIACAFAADLDNLRLLMLLEADYRHDASDNRKAASWLEDFDEVCVPQVHDAFSTAHILTMELLEGRTLRSTWSALRVRPSATTTETCWCA